MSAIANINIFARNHYKTKTLFWFWIFEPNIQSSDRVLWFMWTEGWLQSEEGTKISKSRKLEIL